MTTSGKLITALSLLPMLLGSTRPLMAQEGPITLGLKDAIGMAAERNLDVKVELYNPAEAQADVGRALAIYDPVLTLNASYNRNTTASIFFAPVQTDTATVNAGISQLLPSGGTVGATSNNNWISNSASYYSTVNSVFINQPLLKNFGRETSELNIQVARFSKEGALDRFRTRLSDVVTQVRNDYFTLYSLREELAVKRTSLELANRILADTRGRVNAGVLPAMEILNAEFGVATQEKNVIDAERALRDQVDLIHLRLQLPGNADIVPVDAPTRDNYPVSEQQAVVHALAERPELVAQRVTVATNDLQRRVAKNRLLPDLNLNANLGLAGYDPRFNRTLERVTSTDFPVWGVGVSLNYPLGNHAAENDYIKAKLQVDQAQTQLANLEASVSNEVRGAIRALVASYKQLDVTNRGTAYAERRFAAFQKKNAVGLATTKDVIDTLNDLVTARGNQIRALVEYNNAITNLWRATGEVLDRQGIRVTEQQADHLYNSAK